jgi:hypothetical protein
MTQPPPKPRSCFQLFKSERECLMGVYFMGVPLMAYLSWRASHGVPFVGVHSMGVHSMGVHLIGVHLMACLSWACLSWAINLRRC